jgi:hypothetical protein
MSYQTYQVTQNPEWSCPNMLVFVQNGMVIGHQQNPENKLTQWWAEDHEIVPFNKRDYKKVKLIK